MSAAAAPDPWEGLPVAPAGPGVAEAAVRQCRHPSWDDVSSYVEERSHALWQGHACFNQARDHPQGQLGLGEVLQKERQDNGGRRET